MDELVSECCGYPLVMALVRKGDIQKAISQRSVNIVTAWGIHVINVENSLAIRQRGQSNEHT